jgi:hypothetical protein
MDPRARHRRAPARGGPLPRSDGAGRCGACLARGGGVLAVQGFRPDHDRLRRAGSTWCPTYWRVRRVRRRLGADREVEGPDAVRRGRGHWCRAAGWPDPDRRGEGGRDRGGPEGAETPVSRSTECVLQGPWQAHLVPPSRHRSRGHRRLDRPPDRNRRGLRHRARRLFRRWPGPRVGDPRGAGAAAQGPRRRSGRGLGLSQRRNPRRAGGDHASRPDRGRPRHAGGRARECRRPARRVPLGRCHALRSRGAL